MNVAIVTARILLGSIFVAFGLNGFLHFLPQPPVPEAAGAFFGALAATGYMLPLIFGAQLVGGGLVLAGMVPLGVAILAPVIVNIVFFHLFLAPAGMGPPWSSPCSRSSSPGRTATHTRRCWRPPIARLPARCSGAPPEDTPRP
jgi:uncharacterized membrane protein YphA (DoxX/SURF4 family)